VVVNGHALRALRIKDGWSVASFARAVITTPGHISNIEGNKRGASPGLVKRMAEALGVPISAIARLPEEAA
jgi:transcriptional regulator with XRE-family HTH domain